MGQHCSNSTSRYPDDYIFLGQYDSDILGAIKLFRNNRTQEDVGVREITFENSQELQLYEQEIKLAKTYENIPTLVKIIKYQKYQPLSGRIFFQYNHENLQNLMKQKRQRLIQFAKDNWKLKEQFNAISMHNYQQIQSLPSALRTYSHLKFQQIEIVRMIDHIIGAAFLLFHFDRFHEAIRPNTIFIDSQGKFILADKNVFKIKTNFEGLLQNDQAKINKYISPQIYNRLYFDASINQYFPDKSDIFSVGLLALQMCLIERQSIIGNLYDQNKRRYDEKQLKKCLSLIENNYSHNFCKLLKQMLQINPVTRISYTRLIDSLNPLLNQNLQKINQIQIKESHTFRSQANFHVGNVSSIRFQQNQNLPFFSTFSNTNEDKGDAILKKIIDIEAQFKQIMNNRFYLADQTENYDKIDDDEKKILNKLKKCGRIPGKENKEIKSGQLYQIYLKQYKSIKQTRNNQL